MRSGRPRRPILAPLAAPAPLASLALLAALAPAPGRAEPCAGALEAAEVVRVLATARPGSLSVEQAALLGCLDAGIRDLARRFPQPPSWELLADARRAYRALGGDSALVCSVERLLASPERGWRCAALRGLALYGAPGAVQRLAEECGAAGHLMHLAVAGDTSAAAAAADRYRRGRAANLDAGEERTLGTRDKALLLDVAYYLDTPPGREFIIDAAVTDPDSLVRARADWMIAHPPPPGDAPAE